MSISDHQLAQHQLFRIKHTEINEIFLVMNLRSFVCAMISIFVPIYLLSLGYSLRDVFVLHAVMFGVELSFEYISATYISISGPKHAIALSLPPLVAHFWMLSTLTTYHWPLWFIGSSGGIALALYWQGYHYDFSKSTKKKEATKNVSRMFILLAMFGAVAPFIGGLVVTNYGFSVLYALVVVLLSLVFIPLLKKREPHTGRKIDFSRINLGEIKRDLVSYGGAGVEASVSVVIWPLFVFAVVGSYQSLGLITSAALVLTIFVTYIVGKRVNNTNRHRYITTGSLLDGSLYVLLVFVDSFTQIMSLNIARSLVSSLRQAPYTSEYYLHADENSRQEYIFAMETAIDIAKVGLYLVLIALTFFFSDQVILVIGLLMGAAGALAASLMPRAKCELKCVSKNTKIKLIPKLGNAR